MVTVQAISHTYYVFLASQSQHPRCIACVTVHKLCMCIAQVVCSEQWVFIWIPKQLSNGMHEEHGAMNGDFQPYFTCILLTCFATFLRGAIGWQQSLFLSCTLQRFSAFSSQPPRQLKIQLYSSSLCLLLVCLHLNPSQPVIKCVVITYLWLKNRNAGRAGISLSWGFMINFVIQHLHWPCPQTQIKTHFYCWQGWPRQRVYIRLLSVDRVHDCKLEYE